MELNYRELAEVFEQSAPGTFERVEAVGLVLQVYRKLVPALGCRLVVVFEMREVGARTLNIVVSEPASHGLLGWVGRSVCVAVAGWHGVEGDWDWGWLRRTWMGTSRRV